MDRGDRHVVGYSADRKSTRLNSSHAEIYTLSLHDALPIFGVVLLLGALNGARRAAVKEGMALVGVLLGALLVSLWMDRWGLVLAGRARWQPATGQWIAAIGTLWGTAQIGRAHV